VLSPLREGRLTASVYGAALGLNKFKSRQELWRDLTGRGVPFEGNDATEWGNMNEALAITTYEILTGELVQSQCDFVQFEDWSGCTPDGYVGDGLIEVKCPFSQRVYPEWPVYYRAQVIGQLGITQKEWCDCWCWTPSESKVVERIYHDEKQWEAMLDALREFWACVKDDREPKRGKKFKFMEKKNG